MAVRCQNSLTNKITKITSIDIKQIKKIQDGVEKHGQERTEEITIIWLITPHQWLSKQLINLPNSLVSKFESGDCHLQQPSWLKTNCYRHCSENICTSPQCHKIQRNEEQWAKKKHALLLLGTETLETNIKISCMKLIVISFYAHCCHSKILKLLQTEWVYLLFITLNTLLLDLFMPIRQNMPDPIKNLHTIPGWTAQKRSTKIICEIVWKRLFFPEPAEFGA